MAVGACHGIGKVTGRVRMYAWLHRLESAVRLGPEARVDLGDGLIYMDMSRGN